MEIIAKKLGQDYTEQLFWSSLPILADYVGVPSKESKTVSFEVSRRQADILVSIFNTDGDDDLENPEIREAVRFIENEWLLSIVNIEEMENSQVKCTFTTK